MSLIIRAEKRTIFGKNASRRIRSKGKIPAILYGTEIENVPLIVDKKDIFKVVKSETGENTIFKIVFDSEEKDAMIKEIQKDPTTDELLHADLIHISLDRPIRLSVPVIARGEAVGVKAEGGFVDFITREIEIECLPRDIPEHIEIDISPLHLNQSLKVQDIRAPEGVRIISDPSLVIVHIEPPAVEEVKVGVEEEVISVEKEPEIIKKGKAEEEEEKE